MAEQDAADTDTAIPETSADGKQAESDAQEDKKPAERISTVVEMTDALPVISVSEEPLSALPVENGDRVIVPSLIGRYEEQLAAYEIPNVQISVVYDWYPLPVGVIYAAELTGEITETEFHILPGTELILYVSRGIDPSNAVIEGENQTVYLTFDDGPNPNNTLHILDTLDQYGVHATFFMVGSYVERYPEIVQEVYARGHAIGCHSYSHQYTNLYESTESMQEELSRWETAMENALGFVPPERMFRYPGGSTRCYEDSIHTALPAWGYRCFDWNALNNDCLLSTRPEGMSETDYLKESFQSTIAYSFRLKKSPHIVLMHDTYTQTADILPWMIEYLQDMECDFATLDALSSGWIY